MMRWSLWKLLGGGGLVSDEWGPSLQWNSLQDAIDLAKTVDKPIMVVVQALECASCQQLRGRFASSVEIHHLAENFLMVNVPQMMCPTYLCPDGVYTPRILFLDRRGKLLKITNSLGNPRYKYFYPNPASIIKSMKLVLECWPCNADEV